MFTFPTTFMRTAGGIDVPVDGPDNVYVPTTLDHFTALGIPPPTYLWECQEASGNLESSIGSLTLTKSGAGTALYQQAQAGWSRGFVGHASGNAVVFSGGSTRDLAAGESVAMLAYLVVVDHPNTNNAHRLVMSTQAPTAGPLVQVSSNGTTRKVRFVPSNLTTDHDLLGDVVPWFTYSNAEDDVNACHAGTGLTITQGTYTEQSWTNQSLRFFANNTDVEAYCCLVAVWDPTEAAALATAGLMSSTMLTTLGWP